MTKQLEYQYNCTIQLRAPNKSQESDCPSPTTLHVFISSENSSTDEAEKKIKEIFIEAMQDDREKRQLEDSWSESSKKRARVDKSGSTIPCPQTGQYHKQFSPSPPNSSPTASTTTQDDLPAVTGSPTRPLAEEAVTRKQFCTHPTPVLPQVDTQPENFVRTFSIPVFVQNYPSIVGE